MNFKNYAFTTPSKIPEEFRAYHAGEKNQRILTPINPLERGVFFALQENQANYYLSQISNGQIYFLDLRTVKDARYQKDYQSQIICRDRLNNLDTDEERKEYFRMWYLKHTTPFNLIKLAKQKNKRLGYIIVPAPIKVLH